MKEETNKLKNDEMNENELTLDKETSEVMNEFMNQETYQVKKKEMNEKERRNILIILIILINTNNKEWRNEWKEQRNKRTLKKEKY